MSILRPWRPSGRMKSTLHWPGMSSSTRFLWSPNQRTRTNHCVWSAVFFPQTHWWFRTQEPCRSGRRVRECSLSCIVDRAQWTMPKKITFLMWHPVDAEFRVALGTSVNCNACYKEKNMLKDCNREGCVRKRNCLYVYYKSCRNLNNRRTSTCFLCEGDITRASAILQKQKMRI